MTATVVMTSAALFKKKDKGKGKSSGKDKGIDYGKTKGKHIALQSAETTVTSVTDKSIVWNKNVHH